ncbi:MAG: hypothetical protein ACXVDZ_10580 [Bacteroidia bacterium]
MDEKKPITEFSEAEILEFIKDDPEAIEDYKKETEEFLNRRIYSEDQVIRIYIGKTKADVYSEFTIPELNRMNWAVNFLMDNPCGLMYIQMLEKERKKKKR